MMGGSSPLVEPPPADSAPQQADDSQHRQGTGPTTEGSASTGAISAKVEVPQEQHEGQQTIASAGSSGIQADLEAMYPNAQPEPGQRSLPAYQHTPDTSQTCCHTPQHCQRINTLQIVSCRLCSSHSPQICHHIAIT